MTLWVIALMSVTDLKKGYFLFSYTLLFKGASLNVKFIYVSLNKL